MKNILLVPMLFLAMLIASCSSGDSPPPIRTANVTFNVAIPQLPTRAVNITRYVMAIYTLDDPSTVLHRIEQSGGTFTLELANNTSYVCLFWADETAPENNAGGTYDATNLKNVTLNDGKDMADAFFNRLDITTTETTFNVTLRRPIAQVNIVELESIEANAHIVITHDHYNSFNTFTSDVVESPVSKSITISPTETTGKLGSYYIFAPVAGHLKDFVAVYNSYVTNAIPNVPLKANFVTNINGNYAGGNQNFTFIIEIDEVWDGDKYEVGIISGVVINVGTDGEPIWIEVADRNAESGGPNGATFGSTSIDYGYYYQWSNTANDPSNMEKAYRACFDFGEGNGNWRLPTQLELNIISGNDGVSNADNANRRLKWDGATWKLYDDRVEKAEKFVYFPLAGIIEDASGSTGTDVDTYAWYWSSTVQDNDRTSRLYIDINGNSDVSHAPRTQGLAVRCVKDTKTLD